MAEKFELSKPGAAQTEIKGIDIPSVSIPKGGGAIKGIDEKFEVNPINGSASVSIPVPVAGARALAPDMAITYSSGAGNGLFGAGWSLTLSDISRKTDKGLPVYDDGEESDVYLMAGAEDLVPELVEAASGELVPYVRNLPDGSVVKRYIPRIEGSFSRIENISLPDGTARWKVTSRANSIILLGWTQNARVADPSDPKRIYRWLPEFVYDNLGNCMQYIYVEDKSDNHVQVYPDRILYCNANPWYAGAEWPSENEYLFKTVFDYGQYDLESDCEKPVRNIPVRQDEFSSRRAGFEIRTSWLCRNVLLYNMMKEVSGALALTAVLSLDYKESPSMTLLTSASMTSYRKSSDGSYDSQKLPPMNYVYSEHSWNSATVTADDVVFPSGCSFFDLYGEGIPGILYTDPASGEMLYRSNLGNARFEVAKPVLQRPNGRHFAIMDLEGDGSLQFSDLTPASGGFYEIGDLKAFEEGADDSIAPFRPFEMLPTIDRNSSDVRLVDLNGDGKAEMLVSSDSVYMWYPSEGRKGYSASEYSPMSIDGEEGPDLVFSDSSQSVFLADMTGDGLVDIVRIKCSEVYYYPNLGYGRFGCKVVMDNAPLLSSPSEFDPSKVMLADIDGTGTADLVYYGDGTFRCWMNQCGNRYSAEPYVIADTPAINSMTDISLADILGRGMSCLVWTSALPDDEGRQIRYIDLMSGVKPYLLTGYSNSSGKTVSYQYRPSTEYYLEDKENGNPWKTRLGFPVHCVSKVETFDDVSRWRFVSTYRYRDGYYDHVEREFRGFGMCEQRDTEDFEHWKTECGNLLDRTVHQSPVITRSWVNTGAGKDHGYDELFDSCCDDIIENAHLMTEDEYREALRALAGHVYRSEVYNEGDEMPCAVTVSSSIVKMYQKKGQNRHASFITLQHQSFSHTFEDDPADPRISQSINLSFDEYGNVLEAAAIAYGRQTRDADVPDEVSALQEKTLVTYVKARYTDDIITDDVLMRRVPAGRFTFEVSGLERHSGRFYVPGDFADVHLDGRTRLVQGVQSLYFDDDLRNPLPVGRITFPLISYGEYNLAFTPDNLAEIYGDRITDAMLDEGKYVRLENGYVDEAARGGWWIPSGNVWMLNDGETSDAARERFYAPLKYTDIYGTPVKVEYYGDTWMIVSAVINAFGERASVEEIDFLSLQPLKIKDENGNLSAAIYDVSGRVKASAVMGKGDEADSLEGFSAVTSAEEQALIDAFFKEMDAVRITEIAKRLLGKASVRYLYDEYAWVNESVPVRTATITREQHYRDNPDSDIQITISYVNGTGATVLTKVQAEPDPDRPDSYMRWIGNGRTIVNNKGNAVMQYEPYFSDNPGYDSDKSLVETGVTPIYYYDALGRNVRTEYPDGTFDKVEIHSWSAVTYGAGTTVKESEWYRSRMALDKSDQKYKAAVKSEVYSDIPVVTYTDSLGRAVATRVKDMMTVADLDIEGSLLSMKGPRGLIVQRYTYDHLGRSLHTDGPDNGKRWIFTDAQGNPVRSWNDRGIIIEYHYDVVRRPVSCKVITDSTYEGEEHLDNVFARWEYAESLLESETMESLQERNLIGQVISAWDTAGKVSTDRYDFKGMPLETVRRLTKAYKGVVNWTDDALERDLGDEIFSAHVEVDAMGRMIREVAPDGTISETSYNRGGLMSSTKVHLSGDDAPKEYISGVSYNEKRQRCSLEYGNGMVTRYSFDRLTFMLEEILTTRANGSVVQHYQYTFDVTGHLSHISDKSEKVYYHGNRTVNPDSDFTYDCYGRLVRAEGRENMAAVGRDAADNFDDRDFICQLSDMDSMAIRHYSEEYAYDRSGNILSMHHVSDGNTWKREYAYAEDSNRLLTTRMGDYSYSYEYHPTAGFMVRMPHLADIGWNFLEQVESSTRQVRTDGGVPEMTYYQYDGSGKRIRKTTVCASDKGDGILKDERIYIGGYEVYRRHSGSNKGLERVTLSLMDGASRFVVIERRNDVDDGTDKRLERYQFTNMVGSSVLEVDDRCRVITKEEFTPFGSTSYQARNKTVKAAAKRYRFTGMERDEETGLSYHSARYYIPWLGRWLSADPIGIEGGLNLYCYCGNDPVNKSDVEGTLPVYGDMYAGLSIEDVKDTKKFITSKEGISATIGMVSIVSAGYGIVVGGSAVAIALGSVSIAYNTQQVATDFRNMFSSSEEYVSPVIYAMSHVTDNVYVQTGVDMSLSFVGPGGALEYGIGKIPTVCDNVKTGVQIWLKNSANKASKAAELGTAVNEYLKFNVKSAVAATYATKQIELSFALTQFNISGVPAMRERALAAFIRGGVLQEQVFEYAGSIIKKSAEAPSSLTKKAYDILTEIPKQEAILKNEILSKKEDFVAALNNAPTDRKNLLKTSIDFMKKSFKLWPEDINTGNPLTKGQVLKNHGADASNVLFQAYSAYSLLNN